MNPLRNFLRNLTRMCAQIANKNTDAILGDFLKNTLVEKSLYNFWGICIQKYLNYYLDKFLQEILQKNKKKKRTTNEIRTKLNFWILEIISGRTEEFPASINRKFPWKILRNIFWRKEFMEELLRETF